MDPAGRWSLAPAYDMTYAYNPHGMWTGTHQMSINGKREGITRQDILASARNMGVKQAEAERTIEEVQNSLAEWDRFAEDAGLKEHVTQRIREQFVIL